MEKEYVLTESKYHISDGMFSIYINYELEDNSLSTHIDNIMKFKRSICKYPIFITNTDDKNLEIKLKDTFGFLKINEVFAFIQRNLVLKQ